MSIFTKALKSLRDKKTVEVNDKTISPVSSPKKNITEAERELIARAKNQNTMFDIDIPVHEDLSKLPDYKGRGQNKEEIDVDFDFSNLDDDQDSTDHPGSAVLSINPTRSFSQPVELDLNMLADKGYITPATINTLLGNTFRMIKRPLLNNISDKSAETADGSNLIMLTSSMDGEGKSFSSINLAISMAMEKDKHVLLIDADVNKASHHEIFNYQPEFGLTDLLRGKIKDMSRVLHRTNIPSLTLMSAGNKTSHATELLASDAMSKFVREISSFYKDRVIIFDSPPLLLPTEASVLASHMGQIVLVIEAEKTLRSDVRKSLRMMPDKLVLLLLNQAREKSQIGNYGYYKYEDQT